MKRARRVWERIVTMDACRKAVRDISHTKRVLRHGRGEEMRENCERYAKEAYEKLWDGFTLAPFSTFTLKENGKERLIEAPTTEDAVAIRVITNGCEPIVYSRQIENSYCPIPGRGSVLMARRIQDDLRRVVASCRRHNAAKSRKTPWHCWCLKNDIRKYFQSITFGLVMRTMDAIFDDGRLMGQFAAFLRFRDGLPIGAGFSAMFANAVHAPLDRIVSARRDVYGYHRYMDDTANVLRSKSAAASVHEAMEEWYAERGLTSAHKWSKFRIEDKPLVMGGWRIRPSGIVPSQNVTRHVVRLLSGDPSTLSMDGKLALASLYGYVRNGDSKTLKELWSRKRADVVFSQIAEHAREDARALKQKLTTTGMEEYTHEE